MSRTTRMLGFMLLTGVVVIMVALTLLIGYWVGDRVIPVEVRSTRVLTPIVKSGGKLIMEQDVKYLRNCAAHVDRWLYDSAPKPHRKQLQDVDYERPPRGLGDKPITITEDVPDDFIPGPAYYYANPVYKCNPVHDIVWPIDRPSTIVLFQIQR